MQPNRTATLLIAFLVILSPSSTRADDPPKPDSPLVKLLRAGRVPAERQGTIIDMIGKRGVPSDLDFLFERLLDPAGFSPPNRVRALEGLAEAALTRDLRPAGDLARVAPLLVEKTDPAARQAAVRLAGLWKTESLGPPLQAIAASAKSAESLRASALESLASIGGKAGRESIEVLTRPSHPLPVRILATAALARLDVDAAASHAVEILRDAVKYQADLTPLLAAFLNLKAGPDKLAAAISNAKVPADAAKLALRSVYTLGHSDPSLVTALTKAAGLDAEVKPLEKADMERILTDVATQGSPVRGEAIFRRADVNCSKCHALSSAGGGIGPDLSAVGSSSPVDYLVNSIMLPDQAIKEEFQTRVILTNDGQVFQGIIADKDDKRIILKEATGDRRTIPTSEIEETKEGGSLMPKGLVNFMTRAEFVDLIRFLSELGKPGPYAIRSTPTIQRWRLLKPVDEELAKQVPSEATLRTFALEADPAHWLPAYSRVNGELPLEDLAADSASKVLYLQAEIEASAGGSLSVKLNDPAGIHAWLDDQPAPPFSADAFPITISPGRHTLTFRVDPSTRNNKPLRAEVLKPPGSSAEYTVLGGR